jgi:hypothetical protein
MLRFSSLAALVVAILIAGCGGSNKPSSSAPTGSSKTGLGVNAAYKFSDCMRSHGVSSFPDPQVSSQGAGVKIAVAITPAIAGSPAFKSAQKRCSHLLPGGGPPSGSGQQAQSPGQAEAYVAFAACMRKHGFPRFPDPNSQGQLTQAALLQAGINVQQPALRPTADSCTSVTHGVITKVDVAQSIAELSSGGGSGG